MGNPCTDTPSSPLVTGQGNTTQSRHCLHLFCTTTDSVRSKDAALKTPPQRAFNWLASSVAPLMDRTKHTYSGHPLQTMPCEDYKAKAPHHPPHIVVGRSSSGNMCHGCCVLYFVAVDGNHLIYTPTLNEFSIVLANSMEEGYVQCHQRKNHGDTTDASAPTSDD